MKNQTVRASRRKYHIIYKTTCSVTGRWYVGMHSTDNLDDDYLGSGVRLIRSIKKYGRENHTREILEQFSTRQEASDREKEILTEEFRSNPLCMNCGPGGLGAVDRPATSEETRKKLSEASKAVVRTPEWCAKISASNKGRKQSNEAVEKHRQKMTGYKWTAEQVAARTAGQLSSEKFKQRYRPLMIDGVLYQSGCEAVEKTGIAGSTLKYRLNSPSWVNYRYLDQPEKTGEHTGVARARGPYRKSSRHMSSVM